MIKLNKYVAFTILSSTLLLGGCAIQPQGLGFGIIQNSVDPVTATSETAPKVGEACGVNILGIYAGGDMSIEKAKFQGSITKVSSVNTSVFSFLGIFAKRCTIVTGN